MNSPAALLPAGWREVAGSSNSSSYYTNTVTGHSQKQRPVQQQRHRCFPDPDPLPLQEGPSADDVSGFNAAPVARIIMPRCEEEVVSAVRLAARLGLKVIARGTQHCMGAQSVVAGGIVIDMRYMNSVTYNADDQSVTCETGATWKDVISASNAFGRSPRTLQSYCSFSVGGSMGANAHGITTDFALAESILSFNLVTCSGEVVQCSRNGHTPASRELFSLVLGGYGLFGIVTSARVKTSANQTLTSEFICSTIEDFPDIYAGILADPCIDIKLCRLDITTANSISIYTFRPASNHGICTVSNIGLMAREPSAAYRMIYKWAAPALKELRFAVEQGSGSASDWSASCDRNSLLFESARPLAELSSPLINVDDTFILQEFFVPAAKFGKWMEKTKDVFLSLNSCSEVCLLNCTIRYVQHDQDSVLNYASAAEGSFAFVLYYRLPRTASADALLATFHQRFVANTLLLGGTFYLPYRHHYSDADLLRAYPRVREFCAKKEQYDATGMFDNGWFKRYCLPLCSEEYRRLFPLLNADHHSQTSIPLSRILQEEISMGSSSDSTGSTAGTIKTVSDRRSDSFAQLLRRPRFRLQTQLFLSRVFNVTSATAMYSQILAAVYHKDNALNDLAIYRHLMAHALPEGPLAAISSQWKKVSQLREQKVEFRDEVARIMGRLGVIGLVKDYVAVGDNGKLVLELNSSCGVNGNVWTVDPPEPVEVTIEAAVNRGSVSKVGQHVDFAYDESLLTGVPDAAADLLTMMQGLHHLPQALLPTFLSEVSRVLKPGGLFIVREHDCSDELLPMLDVAHSVFNVLTGVTVKEEAAEIRAFRAVGDWVRIIEASGLRNTQLYEIQVDDPTVDVMMCFYKPPWTLERRQSESHEKHLPERSSQLSPDSVVALQPPSEAASHVSSNTTAQAALDIAQAAVAWSIRFINDFETSALSVWPQKTHPAQHAMIQGAIKGAAKAARCMMQRLDALLTAASGNLAASRSVESQSAKTAASASSGTDFFPPEIFVAYEALCIRVNTGIAAAPEVILHSIISNIVSAFLGDTPESNESDSPDEEHSGDGSTSKPAAVSASETSQIILMLQSSHPDIMTPAFWRRCGFPKQVQSIVATAAGNIDAAAQRLAALLDRAAFEELYAAARNVHSFCHQPGLDIMLGKQHPGNPWWRCICAILGSPHIRITQAMRWAASAMGFGEWISLCETAQALRRHSAASTGSGATGEISKLVCAAKDAFLKSQSITMKTQGSNPFPPILHVAEVVHARYNGDDVTEYARTHCLRGTTLLFDNIGELDSRTRYAGGKIDPKHTFIGQRVGGLFGMQKVITVEVRIDSCGQSLPTRDVLLPKVKALRKCLQKAQVCKKAPQSCDLVYYKLVEWMQVDIVKLFASSLNTSPWYRFPYMDTARTYFSVLRDEFDAAREDIGFFRAVFGQGLYNQLVPGIVMAGAFLQAKLLATPLLVKLGTEYTDTHTMVEHVVFLKTHASPLNWTDELRRIVGDPAPVMKEKDIFYVAVPAFLPFTRALLAMSNLPIEIIDISGHEALQVKVSCPPSTAKIFESEMNACCSPGSRILFKFQFPNGCLDDRVHFSVLVDVAYLLGFLRYTNNQRASRWPNIEISQIFDTWDDTNTAPRHIADMRA